MCKFMKLWNSYSVGCAWINPQQWCAQRGVCPASPTFASHSGELNEHLCWFGGNESFPRTLHSQSNSIWWNWKTCPQGHKRKIFWGGKVIFLIFFPAWNAFSQYRISILVDPKQISVILKVKKGLSSFCNFSSFHFKFLPFAFSIFLLFFHYFCFSFPIFFR